MYTFGVFLPLWEESGMDVASSDSMRQLLIVEGKTQTQEVLHCKAE